MPIQPPRDAKSPALIGQVVFLRKQLSLFRTISTVFRGVKSVRVRLWNCAAQGGFYH